VSTRISKSRFIAGVQCLKRLYWQVHAQHVYHPGFAGSYSIKSVLPALVPEMTYEGMQVPNGKAAGLAWESLIRCEQNDAERSDTKKALLDYCGQDTLAMVRLLNVLSSLANLHASP